MKSDGNRVGSGPAPLFDRQPPRLLGIFAAWRLRAYSVGVAVVYSVVFIHVFRGGGWIVSSTGAPLYTDFTDAWVAGVQALHGDVAALYDPAEFVKIQTALLGEQKFLYPNWPYPPTFSLILAPFGLLPYFWSFVTLDIHNSTRLYHYSISDRPAIAGDPSGAGIAVHGVEYHAWANRVPDRFAARRVAAVSRTPAGSGGRLHRVPHLQAAIRYPGSRGPCRREGVARGRERRRDGRLLAGASVVAFGVSAWEAFPRGLFQQFGVVLDAEGATRRRSKLGVSPDDIRVDPISARRCGAGLGRPSRCRRCVPRLSCGLSGVRRRGTH